MRVLRTALLSLLLSGCLPHPGAQPERFYVLQPAPGRVRYTGPPVVVAPTMAAGFYDSVQIVYSDSAGTRSRYRYSFWTEPPQAVLQAELAARLEGGGGPARWLLRTELREMVHDAVKPPGLVRIAVTARLESLPGNAPVAQRRFTRTAPAPSFDAAGAAAASRAVAGGVLDDILAWVQAQADKT
jgi:cholesterol transport system auxiliary component